MPAQATAKSVMASAKRLIDVRQSCRSSRRMAEISVPAWPMPIHQTKLMMSKPQPTVWLLPQTPMPRLMRSTRVVMSSAVPAAPMARSCLYPRVGLFQTYAKSDSVRVSFVWFGARSSLIAAAPHPVPLPYEGRGDAVSTLGSCELRVGVAHSHEVRVARPRAQVVQQLVATRVCVALRDFG